MKLVIAGLFVLCVLQPAAAETRSGGRSLTIIPAQFHGRWATNQRACAARHFTTVITIDAGGWSSFEEGGDVTSAGRVQRGTHYFRLRNHAGAHESTGTLAMRRDGPRLIASFQDDDAEPVHYSLVRCI